MQCRTCGDHGNLSLLDPEHASLLPQLAAGCSVCHDCVVEMKHWSNFLHTFQTSQTRFQQVLHTQQTDVPLKVARVLVAKLLECDFCCFYTDNKTQLATHMQAHLHTTNTTVSEGSRPTNHPENEGRTLNLKCALCAAKYGDPEIFRWHTENCHGTDAIVKVIKISDIHHNYQCGLCQTVCKSTNLIMNHLSNQHRIKNLPFHCNACGKQFIRREYLEKHQHKCKKNKTASNLQDSVNSNYIYNVEVSKQNGVKCKLCGEEFISENLVKQHVAKFHSVKRSLHKCVHCVETFKSIAHLKSHCHTRHPGKHVLQCDVCDAKFSSCGGYWVHKKFKHENHVLTCNICDAQFTSSSGYTEHKKFKHGETRAFTCDVCSAEFSSYSGYMGHKKYKHGETRVFTCDICDATFSQPYTIRRHKASVHSQLTKSFSCQFCSAKFKCKRYLRTHVHNLHTGTILHCNHCKYNTRRKSVLILHLRRRHSLVKNTFACQFCSAKFKFKQYLQNHVRSVHTGAILHCNRCNYNTRRRSDFILHLRVKHSLVKNTFACQFCSKEFKVKEYLHSHVRSVHTGAILHCNRCNYNTRRRSDFILHLRVKHSLVKNTFACQFCSAKFKFKPYLRTHIRHMHT